MPAGPGFQMIQHPGGDLIRNLVGRAAAIHELNPRENFRSLRVSPRQFAQRVQRQLRLARVNRLRIRHQNESLVGLRHQPAEAFQQAGRQLQPVTPRVAPHIRRVAIKNHEMIFGLGFPYAQRITNPIIQPVIKKTKS